MSAEELEDVVSYIEQEGFDYTFCDYSEFEEITDTKFHKLRKAYVDASLALHKYLGI